MENNKNLSSKISEYNKYLFEHKQNVINGYNWIKANLPEVLENVENITELDIQLQNHDSSKFGNYEYYPYLEYFYGEKTAEVKSKFNYAWLHHIHSNPHHWQHWVLLEDDNGNNYLALDIPYNYIIEMFCDHWSFSWKTGNLYEIENWYKQNINKIRFSKKTKEMYEFILNSVIVKLEQNEREK